MKKMCTSEFYYACYVVIIFFSGYTVPVPLAHEGEAARTFESGILVFGSDLLDNLHQNNQKNENILFSPINIYAALLLVYLGSGNTTQEEIGDLLNVDEPDKWPGVHEKFALLFESSINLGELDPFNEYNLNLTDVIFIDRIKLNKKFVSLARSYYDTDIISVNFLSKKFEAVRTINEFVRYLINLYLLLMPPAGAKKPGKLFQRFDFIRRYIVNKVGYRVPKFYPTSQTPYPKAILASCLNFKSWWRFPFRISTTQRDTFYTPNGPVTVQMMQRVGTVAYANLPWLASEVACLTANPNISVFIILPRDDLGLRYLLNNLAANDIDRIVSEVVQTHRIDFRLPRTKFKWTENLNEALFELGVDEIFTRRADLQHMTKDRYFDVNEIKYVADISITEHHIEASSVTGVKISPSVVVDSSYSSANESIVAGLTEVIFDRNRWEQFVDVEFHVNRPFFVFMYRHDIKMVMFYAAVNNPNGDSSD